MAAFTFWTPLLGLAAGALLLGEPVTAVLAVTLVLVAAGMCLVSR
jgi:drug/metabolite transporter (DMT)-like permease